MGAVDVGTGELVAVAEAQVDVGLRGEVEDGVNAVFLEHRLHGERGCDVAVDKGKVGAGGEAARIVERGTIVELVEGDDVIVGGVGEGKMANDPAGAVECSRAISWQRMAASGGSRGGTNMNPAPPVTRMFLQSASGSNLVLPVSTGASFQIPES